MTAVAAGRHTSLARKARFVHWWSRAWGLIAAGLLVYLAATLPQHIRAEDSAALLRSAGLGLICFNLLMQAVRPAWPLLYALPLTSVGIAIWLLGWAN